MIALAPNIQRFVDECHEHLNEFEKDLVAYSNVPTDRERLNALFRALHNIKGSAGFFDFEKLVDIAHRAEDVVDRMRDGELAISNRIV